MSEKELLPLCHAPSNPSARDVAQYVRKKWVLCSMWAASLFFIAITVFSPLRHQLQAPLESVKLFHSSRPVPPGIWDGWDRLDKIYAFGDSYSSTNFEVDETPPSLDNPFGNPEAEGWEGTGQPKMGPTGPLWIHFLTMEYNETTVRTYDFARGGSTVDRDIVGPVWPTASTLKDQVDYQFLPNYASKHHEVLEWSSSNTLFTTWFGINDILVSYHDLERTPALRIVEEYGAAMLSLYHAGARNFLMINIPPFDRTLPAGKPGLLELGADIADFNTRLSDLRDDLLKKFPEMNIFFFNVHALFLSVMDNAEQFPQTAQLRDTNQPCKAYDLGIGYNGPVDFSRFDSRCAFPADEYLWNDNVHPTYPIHNATAGLIVEDCMGPSGKKRFCS